MIKKVIALIILISSVLIAPPVQAEPNGGQLFQANCAACHAGGTNRIMANKTLKKEALEKYNLDSKEAIVYQVTNGKRAMPAFRGRLKSSQIEAVAEYVLSQAEKGW
jgi:cytochrome c6